MRRVRGISTCLLYILPILESINALLELRLELPNVRLGMSVSHIRSPAIARSRRSPPISIVTIARMSDKLVPGCAS